MLRPLLRRLDARANATSSGKKQLTGEARENEVLGHHEKSKISILFRDL
ncbi:MAG: hypothetical protein AAGD13_05245 [Pseudomonadota bacterium]